MFCRRDGCLLIALVDMLSYWVNVFITGAQSQKEDQDHVVMITRLPQHAYHVCVIRHLFGVPFSGHNDTTSAHEFNLRTCHDAGFPGTEM